MKDRKYFEDEVNGFFTEFFLNGKNLALSIRIHDYEGNITLINLPYLNTLSLTQFLYNNLQKQCREEGFKFKRIKEVKRKYGSRRK